MQIRITFFLIFFLNSCATGPVGGFLFTKNKFSGEINPDRTIPDTVQAKGCQHSFLMLFSFGSASAGETAYRNSIIRIAYVDHSTLSILGLVYTQYCTHVHGASF
ncbi:MAG: TRL-like family protein [Leptospiraceae bacterium]|nr:TRL-like family protein [Leptospiraceae bacterium]MCP5512879.1 TRL-like family protein [Leptospiraceae bacterium]